MRKKSNPPETDTLDEAEFFKQAMRGTQPIADDNRRHSRATAPKPQLRPKPSAEERLFEGLLDKESGPQDIVAGEGLAFRRPGLQDRLVKKLRRGQFPREEELDLHGLTVDQARVALADFLAHCQRRQFRCVRIIHGKGLRSGERGPVLKSYLGGWLKGYEEVLALCSAQRNEGGSGAVYVLLRNPARLSD